MNIASLWQFCTRLLASSDYVNHLDDFLRANQIITVLDVAGGTGYPIIELQTRGFTTSYSDGSIDMCTLFRERTAVESLNIPITCAKWDQLPTLLNSKYDCILCRGNSLIYVDSWQQSSVSDRAAEKLEISLAAFRKLVVDGSLIIDITPRTEFQGSPSPIRKELGPALVDGQHVAATWEFEHDETRQVRVWRNKVRINGDEYHTRVEGLLLNVDDLRRIAAKAGWSRISDLDLGPDSQYDTLLCRP